MKLKQVTALESEAYTVTTRLFSECTRPLLLHDVEPVIGRVINQVRRFDRALGIGFGFEKNKSLFDIASVGYSADYEIAGRACSVYIEVERRGQKVSEESIVSVRYLDRDLIEANGIPREKAKKDDLLYFHRRDLPLLRVEDGKRVLVIPQLVFSGSAEEFDFSLLDSFRQR